MADIKYLVKIEHHKSRAPGVTAKQALDNCVRNNKSPITRAQLIPDHGNKETKIEVIIQDSPLEEIIRRSIEKSGRMPTTNGTYSIEEISFQEVIQIGEKEPSSIYETDETEINRLREENELLKELTEKSVSGAPTPLLGLLSYFNTTNYSLNTIFEEGDNLDFAIEVMHGKRESSFRDYVNFVTKENYDEEEIQKRLTSNTSSLEESLKELTEFCKTARDEQKYLKNTLEGISDVPNSIKEEIVSLLRSRKNPERIQEYETEIQRKKEEIEESTNIKRLKEKYNKFYGNLELITEASSCIPVIFNYSNDSLDIYFPFKEENSDKNLLSKLSEEIKNIFNESFISTIENNYVSYRIENPLDSRKRIAKFVEEIPLVLKISGYNCINPCIIKNNS